MASSSSCLPNKSYDVFLSFRGEDTRKTFVGHLYAALEQQGISTFKDDERLEKGKKISDELLQAIRDSRVYIIVFSKNYASSSWCLNELLEIMQCHKTNEHTAFPVFYDVDPSEVRKQSGSVGEAFAIHTNKNKSEVGEWREALKQAANLSGWDLRKTADGDEAKVIKLIVEKVSFELNHNGIIVDKNLVGMEQRMQALDQSLEIGLSDVRMIGIKGMGGAGKTTLARSIFDIISVNFDGKSFVENVREKASKLGLEKLQEQVLSDVLKDKSISVPGVHEGKNLMLKKLRGKKVLVVLDDVDHAEQLDALAGDLSWFKPGSRIIITTRDVQVLNSERVKWIHDANLLSNEEAICLFSRHAFGIDIPAHEYEKQSLEVIRYAAGLPLTIKVLGSFLRNQTKRQWRDALARLKTIPLKETLKILEISFESLEDDCKEIFLDVACFFRYWNEDYVIRMLESCGFHAVNGLRVLEQKSLITVDKKIHGSYIQMHDHLVEMGMNIVRRDHPDEPCRYSRLWVQEEIESVLDNNSGSVAARCVYLRITPTIFLGGLENMKTLRCLIVNNAELNKDFDDCVRIDKSCQYFLNSLRCLHWRGYFHRCLPKTFEANNLVSLDMPGSKIEQLWELGGKVMENLKFLDLSESKLRSLDLGLTPKLERLNLERCEDLVKLDVHGGCLKSLVYLNIKWCNKLKSISFIKQFESLEFLNIKGLELRKFPGRIFKGNNNSLLELKLSYNDISEIPSSIRNLRNLVYVSLSYWSLKRVPGSIELPEELGQFECLEYLKLSRYTDVKHLPNSICKLKRLKTLILKYCHSLEKLPEDVGELESLEVLNLKYCFELREIPSSICKLKHLKVLNLQGCKNIQELPDELVNLGCLQLLDIRNSGVTHLPHSISLIKGLKIKRSN